MVATMCYRIKGTLQLFQWLQSPFVITNNFLALLFCWRNKRSGWSKKKTIHMLCSYLAASPFAVACHKTFWALMNKLQPMRGFSCCNLLLLQWLKWPCWWRNKAPHGSQTSLSSVKGSKVCLAFNNLTQTKLCQCQITFPGQSRTHGIVENE